MSDTNKPAELTLLPQSRYKCKITGVEGTETKKDQSPMLVFELEFADNKPFDYPEHGTIDVNGRKAMGYVVLNNSFGEQAMKAIHHVNSMEPPKMEQIIENRKSVEDMYLGKMVNVCAASEESVMMDEVLKEPMKNSMGEVMKTFRINIKSII